LAKVIFSRKHYELRNEGDGENVRIIDTNDPALAGLTPRCKREVAAAAHRRQELRNEGKGKMLELTLQTIPHLRN
jgi:hypothetical protein